MEKTKPYLARRTEEKYGVWYQVKVTSLLLYELANRPFEDLVPYIEPYPTGFLRGFFTAEGNPSISINRSHGRPVLQVTLCVSNTEIGYVHFAIKSVERLGYRPTNITRGDRPGLERTIGVRSFITTKTEWQFRIARISEVESFLMKVGFADKLKQEKAWTALNLIKEFGAHAAAGEWAKMYVKVGRKWVRKIGP
jgi:intein-encoded DNA endonuclease-like protein